MNEPKYILKLPEAIGLFPKGESVIERSHAAQLLRYSGPEITTLAPGEYRPLSTHGAKAGQTVLFVRPGGFGDMLFITPTMRALKEQCPKLHIQLSAIPKYAEAVRYDRAIDEILPYPPTLEAFRRADAHVWLERILEDAGDAKTVPAVEMIARHAGVVVEDYSMRYELFGDEWKWGKKAYPHRKGGRVGIQVQASALNRTYPAGQLNRVMNELVARGWEVFLFGDPGSVEADEPFVNLTNKGYTFRQSCAILNTCDVVIAPDSALCHVAAALNKPTVALFGPFPSAIRSVHESTVRALDGTAPCAPCHHHDNTGIPWPEGCPGWRSGQCAALQSITPEKIVETVTSLL